MFLIRFCFFRIIQDLLLLSQKLNCCTNLFLLIMKIRSLLFGNLKSPDLLWIVIFLIPALYINLGMLPLGGDEAIRALVSLEMIISGDYLTPTLNGELYFNKPPLFNWLLIAFFKIFNSNSEFICRLPTTLFLIIYCITIYLCLKKRFGPQFGILTALMFLTCARILFWDSFLGLIDITYSWLIFLNFMLIWYLYEKKKYFLLFIISYILIAISFLLKGIPSLAFQALTLLVLFISNRNFKKLLSWQHTLGIIVFFLILSIYYYLYYLRNPESIGTLLQRLISESTQKSALGTRIFETILHIIKFPIEIIYHFLPWTLLVILFFNKKILKRAFAQPFFRYILLVFMVNLTIYWLSPVTYPRYLLMLMPLLFIALLYLAKYHALANTLNYRILVKLLYVFSILLSIAAVFLPVVFKNQLPVNHVILKSAFLLIAVLFVFYELYFKRERTNMLYTLGILLLICRISFNLFLVPYRQSISWSNLCREDALQLANITQHEELFLMSDTITTPNAYYITRERNEILTFINNPAVGPYYIVNDTALLDINFKKEFTMRTTIKKEDFYLGKFTTVP